jgi:hypothetical protein
LLGDPYCGPNPLNQTHGGLEFLRAFGDVLTGDDEQVPQRFKFGALTLDLLLKRVDA